MKQLKIIGKTELGDKNILDHYHKVMKQSWVKREMLKKTGYRHILVSNKPCILYVWASPNSAFSMVKPKHFIEEVKESFEKDKAIIDIDYIIEVQE